LTALLDVKAKCPFADEEERFIAGRFGMTLFLVSLAMLFAASIIGFVVIRVTAGDAWPANLPSLPWQLWLSTAVLVASSVSMQRALLAARAGRSVDLRRGLEITLVLAAVFLILQVWSWASWLTALGDRLGGEDAQAHRFALSGFYVLSGVHALHVIGGLVPMTVVTRRARRGRYSARRHGGVQYCAMYWHFLDGVWLTLFAALLIGL
jgi:cytochrome c oxidase subunit 3